MGRQQLLENLVKRSKVKGSYKNVEDNASTGDNNYDGATFANYGEYGYDDYLFDVFVEDQSINESLDNQETNVGKKKRNGDSENRGDVGEGEFLSLFDEDNISEGLNSNIGSSDDDENNPHVDVTYTDYKPDNECKDLELKVRAKIYRCT